MSAKKHWHSRRQKLYITDPGNPQDNLALIIYRVTESDFLTRAPALPLERPPTFPLLRGRVSCDGRTYHVGGETRAQVVSRLAMVVMTSERPSFPKNQKIP